MIQLRILVIHKVVSPIKGIKFLFNDVIKEKFSRMKKKWNLPLEK